MGLPSGHDQTLLADHQVQHHDLGHQPLLFEIGQVVGPAGRVEQVAADDMRFAAFQGDQATQRADIAGRDLETRILAPQLIVKHTNGEIIAAGEQNGIGNLLSRTQEFDRHFLAGIQTLIERGNPQHAIGLDHRRNHPGPTAERIGNQPLADFAQTDPHKFF